MLSNCVCSYDPETRSGASGSDRKVKGTIHWVSAEHAVAAEVRLYDRLFTDANPGAAEDIHTVVNPASLEVVEARVESSLGGQEKGQRWQFERLGYFWPDEKDHAPDKPVFNRIVTLRDSWAKLEKAALAGQQG